ncbi:hypothetical protein PCYB_091110 [Plasmodium cynomolgi strain B]|uniref:t-SNARE coiled-coil homology domain-containing protein n=1 Tax=Plasmodium cynomolgi (strain B) TaxID=1120755 RepID=K6UVJ3_PLACD|nr:hypothetical protein PCYB_091110 [Plasmodium cynomolgi strain B]GAB66325.1 hypothetical protein PCYB_091110 [Plasmodium cynomolgi strain B]
MSYSTKKKESKKTIQKNANNFEFSADIQNDISIIQSYTARISKINENEVCSVESSEKVQEIVQEGKVKIQEIQRKIKSYSSSAENAPPGERVRPVLHPSMRMKLMLQKLSNSYIGAVNNFQSASKNYINKTVLNDRLSKNVNASSNNLEYDSLTNFSRNSDSNYDSSRDKFNVNIYDFNFNENENYDGSYAPAPRGMENTSTGKKMKKKYKSNIFTGSKKSEVNEYLLQNDAYGQDDAYLGSGGYGPNVDLEDPQQERQFVSVKTVDIENEILSQKNKEIKKLHKDIINIQELYKELFDQVNIQGESIDNIDSQIITTHDNILMSGREIEITRNRYFRNIRCMGFLFFVLIILIIIILVVFRVI